MSAIRKSMLFISVAGLFACANPDDLKSRGSVEPETETDSSDVTQTADGPVGSWVLVHEGGFLAGEEQRFRIWRPDRLASPPDFRAIVGDALVGLESDEDQIRFTRPIHPIMFGNKIRTVVIRYEYDGIRQGDIMTGTYHFLDETVEPDVALMPLEQSYYPKSPVKWTARRLSTESPMQ